MARRSDDDYSTELSRTLRALRTDRGLNQLDVVARTSIGQPRLSNIEQGKAVPSEADVAALAAAYELDTEQREQLLAMTRAELAKTRDERLVIQRGKPLRMQRRWKEREAQAAVVRSYHPALVLGVLQTAAYASVVLNGDAATVADRQQRHEALLTRDTTRFVLIQTEGALRFRVGSASLMVEQLEAIARASRRPNVEFGLIPWWKSVQVTPTCGFHIYDEEAAVVGLELATAEFTPADDLAKFRALFDCLVEAAVWGEDARAELERIAAETA